MVNCFYMDILWWRPKKRAKNASLKASTLTHDARRARASDASRFGERTSLFHFPVCFFYFAWTRVNDEFIHSFIVNVGDVSTPRVDYRTARTTTTECGVSDDAR